MIHINNIKLTGGKVLVELEEPFITIDAINKLTNNNGNANISKETRDNNRINTTIRHGKVILMSDDIKDFIFGEKKMDWNKMELERYQSLQYLRDPNVTILINIQYDEPFDVPMFKGMKDINGVLEQDSIKVGHCLKLNPSNIMGYLTE